MISHAVEMGVEDGAQREKTLPPKSSTFPRLSPSAVKAANACVSKKERCCGHALFNFFCLGLHFTEIGPTVKQLKKKPV